MEIFDCFYVFWPFPLSCFPWLLSKHKSVRTLQRWVSWETTPNACSLWRPARCAIYSIPASPDPASTPLCSEFWEAAFYGLASMQVQWLRGRAARRRGGSKVSVFASPPAPCWDAALLSAACRCPNAALLTSLVCSLPGPGSHSIRWLCCLSGTLSSSLTLHILVPLKHYTLNYSIQCART